MAWQDEMKKSMAKMVEAYTSDSDVEVIKWEEDIEYGGYCNTCFYESAIMRITYTRGADDKVLVYTYDGSFSDLIQTLTQF